MTNLERLLRGDPATYNGDEIVQVTQFPILPRDNTTILIVYVSRDSYGSDWEDEDNINEVPEDEDDDPGDYSIQFEYKENDPRNFSSKTKPVSSKDNKSNYSSEKRILLL